MRDKKGSFFKACEECRLYDTTTRKAHDKRRMQEAIAKGLRFCDRCRKDLDARVFEKPNGNGFYRRCDTCRSIMREIAAARNAKKKGAKQNA